MLTTIIWAIFSRSVSFFSVDSAQDFFDLNWPGPAQAENKRAKQIIIFRIIIA